MKAFSVVMVPFLLMLALVGVRETVPSHYPSLASVSVAQSPDPQPPTPPKAKLTLTVPLVPNAQAGRLTAIAIDTNAKFLKWTVLPSDTVDIFREFDPESSSVKLRAQFLADGTYWLVVSASDATGLLTETRQIIVGVPVPPKPPTPPTPPTPPDPPPTPDVVPIPGPGLHVLMVYDEKKKTEMTSQQQAVLFGKTVTDYLSSKCPISKGPEGDAYEWRVYGTGFDVSADSKTWKDAMARPRTSLPWIVIGMDGKRGFEGPLPATVDETMALLKKYGG